MPEKPENTLTTLMDSNSRGPNIELSSFFYTRGQLLHSWHCLRISHIIASNGYEVPDSDIFHQTKQYNMNKNLLIGLQVIHCTNDLDDYR